MDETVKVELERIRDEDTRQNHRIDKLEKGMEETFELSKSVHELAINMQHMLEELKSQNERIAAIEMRPIETMRDARKTAISTIVSFIVGAAIAAVVASMK